MVLVKQNDVIRDRVNLLIDLAINASLLLQSEHASPTLFLVPVVIQCLLWLWCNVRLKKKRGTTTTKSRPEMDISWIPLEDRFWWLAGTLISLLGMRAAHTHGELARVLHGTTTTTDDRRYNTMLVAFQNVTTYACALVCLVPKFFCTVPVTSNLRTHVWSIKCS